MFVGQMSIGQVSVICWTNVFCQMSVGLMPVDQMSVSQTFVAKMFVSKMSVGQMSVSQWFTVIPVGQM